MNASRLRLGVAEANWSGGVTAGLGGGGIRGGLGEGYESIRGGFGGIRGRIM